MTNIIGVRFKKIGKIYYFDPCGQEVRPGDHVIVETARGVEYGEAVMGNTDVEDETVVQPLKKMLRVATEADREVVEENERHAREAFDICKKKIAEHGLDMRLVTVECTFDLNKILFYFTADGRVDFRELVKDLAGVFRTRIELRQIGVRDEAKMLGGLGACGRELCCSSYLDDFQPISINMAKEQNLSLNPAKISGTCGRLMCCLKYEHEVYAELQKVTPRQGSVVETPEGTGTVVSAQMLRGTCKVQLDDSADSPKVFSCEECRMLRAAKGGRGGRPCCAQRAEAQQHGTEAAAPIGPDDKAEGRPDRREDRPARAPRAPQDGARSERREKPARAPQAQADAPAPADGAAADEGRTGERRRRSRRGGRRRSRKPAGEGAPSPSAQPADSRPEA